ncbi:MAG: RluA family pseudouridine synthase [Bryobacterales bacterium]|nr:RluA family pseudouridine synthase [Bryobacteraceae bacterium]MDW8130204.1 RluA family pseudouridine synthase [Bryobacterales bacterium]
MPVRVLYEDEHFLVTDKPPGRLVIPGGTTDEIALVDELARQRAHRLYVVHRLDRDASGIVLFAKTAAAHRAACLEFQHRRARKKYWVVVRGELTSDGEIAQPLRVSGSGRSAVDPRGKPACTRYRVVEKLYGATLLEVEPTSGRHHQIRAHLYWLGHPVLGDRLYGRDRPVGKAPRLMLHAWWLEIHPEGYPPLAVSSPLPEDFRRVLDGLRRRAANG